MADYPSAIQDNTTDLPNNKVSGSTLSPTEWNKAVTAIVALENKVLDTASAPTGPGQVYTSVDNNTATWQTPNTNYYTPGGTDVTVTDGGTGASTAAGARTNLGAASIGANSDITSLSGLTTPLTVAQGGTGTKSGRAISRVVTPAYIASYAPNLDTTDVIKITLLGNITIGAPTGTFTDGQTFRFEFRQDATAGRTATWNAIYAFPGDVTPTLSTTANYKDILPFVYDALTNKFELFASGPLTFTAGK